MRFFAVCAVAVFALVHSHFATAETFTEWADGVRTEALAQGIDSEVLDVALASLDGPIVRVLELDRRQVESKITLREYLALIVDANRISKGQRMAERHSAILQSVRDEFHVQPRFILAIWGIETRYGDIMGGFPVLNALATLAYEGRRKPFFRKELLAALKIMDEEEMTPESMLGSWAGAMGQGQFMPTSYTTFAFDQDRDGRRDIWTNKADALASIANYLKRHGWRDDITWGRKVRLPGDIAPELLGLEVTREISEWQALGVRRANGDDLPTRRLDASLVVPDYPEGDAFLVYANFRTILKYNRSSYYAIAVGLLSDQLRGAD